MMNQGASGEGALNELIQRDAEYIDKDKELYINHLQKALRAVKLQVRGLQLDTRELHRRLLESEEKVKGLQGQVELLKNSYREIVIAGLEITFNEDVMQVRKWRSKVGQKWVGTDEILRVVKDSDLINKLKKAGKELS